MWPWKKKKRSLPSTSDEELAAAKTCHRSRCIVPVARQGRSFVAIFVTYQVARFLLQQLYLPEVEPSQFLLQAACVCETSQRKKKETPPSIIVSTL